MKRERIGVSKKKEKQHREKKIIIRNHHYTGETVGGTQEGSGVREAPPVILLPKFTPGWET